MISFDSPLYCVRCEQPIILGGLLFMHGMDKPQHMCLGCAIHEGKQFNTARGVDTTKIQIIKPDIEDTH